MGEGWIWAPDHNLLERFKFPLIKTLDTSKTPKAGESRILAPVLASTDIAHITRQIEEIQTAQQVVKKTGRGTKFPALAEQKKAAAEPVAPSNIIRLEKGRSSPSTRTLQRIASATGHELQIAFRQKA